jgi:membrane protein
METVQPECEPVTRQSLKELLTAVVSKWSEINAPRQGAALSFYTMLSIAPLLVVSIAIAGMAFGEQAARGQIVWQIQNLVGREGGQAIQAMLEHARRPDTGVLAGLFGIVTLLFGASGVFIELRDSLNLIWGVRAKHSSGLKAMVRDRFTAFTMVIGIGFLLMVSLVANAAITAAGHFFGGFLPLSEAVLHIVNIVVSFVGVTLCFALLYKAVPDARIEWRDVWMGAAVTAALFTAGKFLIGLYIGKAALSSTYGAAGSLVVFLVWVYYSAQAFYLGAEFTHAFAERHGSRALTREVRDAPPHHTPHPRAV